MPVGDESGDKELTPTIAAVVCAYEWSFKDLQLPFSLSRPVVYPSLKLPFVATSMTVGDRPNLVAVWNQVDSPFRGRPRQPGEPEFVPQVAIVDLKANKVLATNKVTRLINGATMAGKFVVLTSLEEPTSIDILDTERLQKVKSLVTANASQRVEFLNDQLIIHEQNMIEVFDPKTWKRLRQIGPFNPGVNLSTNERGVLVDGIFEDYQGKPQFIAIATNLPVAGNFDGATFASLFPSDVNPLGRNRRFPGQHQGQNELTIPGTKMKAATNLSSRPIVVPNSIHTSRSQTELTLTITGDDVERVTLLRQVVHATNGNEHKHAAMVSVSDGVCVLYEDRLFNWQRKPDKSQVASDSLSWQWNQSSFLLDRDGETTLKHPMQGGQAPYRYELMIACEGVSIDETTGDVRANWSEMRPELIKQLRVNNRILDLRIDSSREQYNQLKDWLAKRLKISVKGMPVATPIRIRVTDSEDSSLTFQYLIIGDIPFDELKGSPTNQPAGKEIPSVVSPGASAPADTAVARQAPGSAQQSTEMTMSERQAELKRANKRIEALENQVQVLMKLIAKPDKPNKN